MVVPRVVEPEACDGRKNHRVVVVVERGNMALAHLVRVLVGGGRADGERVG